MKIYQMRDLLKGQMGLARELTEKFDKDELMKV